MDRGSFISREESVMLQGLAVLLMVIHHLIGFPDRIHVEYYNLIDFSFFHFETMISYFGRICIALFAFSSGYGIMKKMDNSYSSGKDLLKKGYETAISRLKKFYAIYWMVFIVFVPYGMLTHKYSFHFIQFVKNFIGISCTYNGEWWYTFYYIKMILFFPILFLIAWYLKQKMKNWGIYLLTVAGLLFCLFGRSLPGHSFMCVFYGFLLGSLCVYASIFEKIYSWMNTHKIIGYFLMIMMLGIALFVRIYVSQELDYLIAPVVVFAFIVFVKSNICFNVVKICLSKMGKYSTYIWLTHTFFAYYYWQNYLYSCRYSIIIVAVCIFCCIIVGIVLEQVKKSFTDLLQRGFNKS